jgi:toxin ParE1/3/4
LGTYRTSSSTFFYLPHEDHVDVWRVLHGERDVPEWLR